MIHGGRHALKVERRLQETTHDSITLLSRQPDNTEEKKAESSHRKKKSGIVPRMNHLASPLGGTGIP